MLETFRMIARYSGVVLTHKWAIIAAGLDVNRRLANTGVAVPLLRLVKHDLSKLSKPEFMPYAIHFSGPRHGPDIGFDEAWKHHYQHNDHHPEHFKRSSGEFDLMPDEAVVEMVVDWMAATRAYEGAWPCCGGHWRWVEHSWDKLGLHPVNKALAGAIVCALGYSVAIPHFDWEEAHHLALDASQRQKIRALHATLGGPVGSSTTT